MLSATEETPRSLRGRGPGQLDEFVREALDRAGEPGLGDAAARWRRVCERDDRVPAEIDDPYFAHGPDGPPAPPEALVGVAFRELPDPFVPLARLRALGYVFDAVTDDAVVLVAPPA